MVRKQINPFTSKELMDFAREHYPESFIKPTTKHRKHLYIRRTVILLLWESSVKVGEIAKLLGETHPNVSIALPKITSYFTTDGSDLFFKCYNEFVEKYNNQQSKNQDESASRNTSETNSESQRDVSFVVPTE